MTGEPSTVHVAELRDQGFTILHGGLAPHEVATAKAALAATVEEDRASGRIYHVADLDPNDRNLRVINLLGRAPIWEHLANHPTGRALVAEVLATTCVSSRASRPTSRCREASRWVCTATT